MSSVTDIILVTMPDSEQTNVERLNAVGNLVLTPTSRHMVGSGKNMQCEVFICAKNFLDHEDFIAAFRAIQWDCPERVQLMLKGESDELFTVYSLLG